MVHLQLDVQLIQRTALILDAWQIDIAPLAYTTVRVVFDSVEIIDTQLKKYLDGTIAEIAKILDIPLWTRPKYDVALFRCLMDQVQGIFWCLTGQISTIMVSF